MPRRITQGPNKNVGNCSDEEQCGNEFWRMVPRVLSLVSAQDFTEWGGISNKNAKEISLRFAQYTNIGDRAWE